MSSFSLAAFFTDFFILVQFFVGIKQLFNVNITNYLISVIKLLVILILWSFLKYLLVFSSCFATTSQFIWIEGWLASFFIVWFFCCGRFWKKFTTFHIVFDTFSTFSSLRNGKQFLLDIYHRRLLLYEFNILFA